MTAVTDPADDIAAWRARFETVLDGQLPSERAAVDGLHQAMRYAALAGGKRFRPVLVYATGQALGLELARLDPIAAAIEFIHA
jgi:geranylgeranyl pyrophosphate synthase